MACTYFYLFFLILLPFIFIIIILTIIIARTVTDGYVHLFPNYAREVYVVPVCSNPGRRFIRSLKLFIIFSN